MVSPSSRHALMSKKSTSSLLERTRLTASPKEQTGIPSLVNLSSGSRVRFPASMTRLKLTIAKSSSFWSFWANFTGTSSVLKYLSFSPSTSERCPREEPYPSPEMASTPKVAMTVPEILLTHRNPPTESFARKRQTAPLKRSHHSADPENTPTTNTTAERYPSLASTKPSPTKIAAKERIVVGLVSVRPSVEAYAPATLMEGRDPLAAPASRSAGFSRKALMPRYKRNTPPPRRSQACCSTSRSLTQVRPKAATQP